MAVIPRRTLGVTARKRGNTIMQNDFTRDPSDYRPSTHLIQQKKDRDIHGDAIETAIVNGRVVERIEDSNHDNYGLLLKNTWLGMVYKVAIIPPSWEDNSKGTVKTVWHEGMSGDR